MNNSIYPSIHPSIDAGQTIVFEPSSWLTKIDFISQFILHNNVLISILGEAGSGKTTFGHLLQEKLDSNVQSALVTALPLFERSAFIGELCSLLGIEEKISIAEVAAEMGKHQTRSLVIVDNAEQLPEAFIKELLEALKDQEGNEFFHVCLLSNFSLVKITSRLAREAYKDMIHSIELQPLNEAESKEYVIAYSESPEEFRQELTDEWMQEFYQLTEGHIASMNTNMESFFSNKPKKASLSYKPFLLYGGISIVALLVLGTGFLFFSKTPSPTPAVETLASDNVHSITLELPLSSDIPNYQVASIRQPLEVVSLQKAELWDKNDDGDDGVVDDDSLVVMDKVVTIPKVVHPAPVKKVAQKVAKVSVVSVKPQAKAKAKPVHPALRGAFTLQLMASRDKNILIRLAKQYPASARVKVRSFSKGGINWYVLTQGEYAQKPLAKQAVTKLPRSFSQFKPWVRSTVDLKDVG